MNLPEEFKVFLSEILIVWLSRATPAYDKDDHISIPVESSMLNWFVDLASTTQL